MATTPPMKNPTAIELWNFLMIIVPPMLNVKSMIADQRDVNDSLKPRLDMTMQDIRESNPVNPKIEYLWIEHIDNAMQNKNRWSESTVRHSSPRTHNFDFTNDNSNKTYHHPAMRRRDDPPQRESASIAVYVESEALMIS